MSNGAYLLYDRRLHAAGLHLLLQEDLLLGLDDVLRPVGSTDHLQDLTWEAGKQSRCEGRIKGTQLPSLDSAGVSFLVLESLEMSSPRCTGNEWDLACGVLNKTFFCVGTFTSNTMRPFCITLKCTLFYSVW